MLALAAWLLAIAAPAQAGLFGDDPKTGVDYAPASALIAHGAVQIGAFSYLPAMSGKLKPDDVGTSNITLTRNVADVVRESLLKEFRFTGIAIDSGPTLSAEIREFRYGIEAHVVTIRYSVKDAQGVVLYDAEKSTNVPFGGGNVSAFDNSMTRNFEALIRDPDFLKAINGGLGGSLPYVEATSSRPSFVYVPSSAFVVSGAVSIGIFDYQRAEKVEADQIPNTAIGNIHLDRPVATYFAEALLKELRLTGVKVESSDRILSGTITSLSDDDLGSSATVTLAVKYVVKDGTGNNIYEGEKVTKLTTQKTLEFLNSALRRNFEALLLDGAFLKAIGAPDNPGNVAQTVVRSDGWHWVQWSGYGPRSALTAHGAVEVGPFAYSVKTAKMEATEIPNRALMTTVNADKPIAELMHDLTLNELRSTGIQVRGSDRMLTGDIQKYKTDDIATPQEWMITVHFSVKDKAGTSLYDAVKTVEITNDKYVVNFLEMKLVIEALISDPDFIKAIN